MAPLPSGSGHVPMHMYVYTCIHTYIHLKMSCNLSHNRRLEVLYLAFVSPGAWSDPSPACGRHALCGHGHHKGARTCSVSPDMQHEHVEGVVAMLGQFTWCKARWCFARKG